MAINQYSWPSEMLKPRLRRLGANAEARYQAMNARVSVKVVTDKVRHARLENVLGSVGSENVQGEVQQKLDVYADEALFHCLGVRESVGILASEENEHPKTVGHNSPNAKYAVVFDPLDGSSNIDVNVSVGTTFSVLRRPAADKIDNPLDWVLQPGACQVAAGYVVYGSSTIMVYTVGNGVHGFTLDPAIGAYVLSHPDIRMPKRGKIYSVNEAYRDSFPPAYNAYLDKLRTGGTGKPYASRYIGSMVADFHRTLLKGGVFLYPPTTDHPGGKLRLLYEANPIAFIAEQAGGQATDGRQRILDIVPESIHQRTPLIVGSEFEMEEFARSVMTA